MRADLITIDEDGMENNELLTQQNLTHVYLRIRLNTQTQTSFDMWTSTHSYWTIYLFCHPSQSACEL